MVAPVTTYLGIGMYTPAEAAMYARVSSRMMSRWVHGDKIGRAALRAQIPETDDKTVTFLDFIQTLAIRAIREQKEKVPLQKIREAIELATTMGVPYPFARQHSTFLWDGEIQLEVAGQLIQASGRRRGQFTMRQIVEVYLKDLTFDNGGLANQYTACDSMGVKILMRPGYKFGEPFLESSGHTAWTLWHACISEGSIEAAAEAYGVTEEDVRVAYKYIDSIRPATAA